MKNNKDPFNKNLLFERKDGLPVKAMNPKLNDTSNGKQVFVKCVSTMPLAFQTSKEEIRINYIHAILQGKTTDTRYNNLMGQPNMPIQLNNSFNNNGQKGINPFIKDHNGMHQQYSVSPQSHQTQNTGLNMFTKPNNNFPNNNVQYNNVQNNNSQNNSQIYKNPFSQNQSQINNTQNQNRNMSLFSQSPSLGKQTSFGGTLPAGSGNLNPSSTIHPIIPKPTTFGQNISTGAFGQTTQITQPQTGLFGTSNSSFSGQTSITQPLNTGINQSSLLNLSANKSLPGQLTQTPSFGNLSSSNINQQQLPQFGQGLFQPQQAQTFGAQNIQNVGIGGNFSSQPITQSSLFSSVSGQGSLLSGGQPHIQAKPSSSLQQNIKQLLQSKPNLWNILALDPQYKNGFNESGRKYVKSVLQRIVDQKILGQQSLQKVIVQIYKQMYGPQNFQKVLQAKKKQSKDFYKKREYQMDRILSKQYEKLSSQSVFPTDLKSLSDDFYRSTKRRTSNILDTTLPSDGEQNQTEEYKQKLQRKYFQIKRPQKKRQLKVKFVEYKNLETKSSKSIQNPYSVEELSKISQQIHEIRSEHRKIIMPKVQDLPIVEGFILSPSLEALCKYSKLELTNVPKVMISNEWGCVKFKAGVSLLRKTISQCIVINQKSVEIIDEEWKVRDAQITFKKFANFNQLELEQQDQLQDKIITWCQKQKFEIIKIDRQTGEVVIQI